MLLQRLREYSERLDLPPSLYAETPLRYVIDLAANGSCLSLSDTADASDRKTRRGVMRMAPQVKRAVGIKPLLFADNAEYTFGLAREGSREERVHGAHAAYLDLLDECLVVSQSAEVRAVQTFLSAFEAETFPFPGDFDRGAMVTFRVDGRFVIDLPAVQAFWASANADTDAPRMQCLICGQTRPVLELQNVLYVVTEGSILRLDHDAVRVELDRQMRARFPLNNLSGIVALGQVSVTSSLLGRCAEDGRSVVWLDRRGRFLARVEGRTRGNVLLRRAQHLALSDIDRTWRIARQIVAGKLQNARQVLLRGAREATDPVEAAQLAEQADHLGTSIERLALVGDLETIRGIEGDAARAYFEVFPLLVRVDRDVFAPDGRSRRPPRDRMNALLSFLYALLRSECASGLEGVGLDPQVGFLHALRPGRPALALDLMEELRPVLVDRLALTLVNRRQLTADHFEEFPGGAVYLTDEGRRLVISAYQRRKEDVVRHRVMRRNLPLGLVPHVQARVLARHLRGDLDNYLPFVTR